MPQNMGPVMLDIAGTELSSADQEILQHPLVGGVILFSRNFSSRMQIQELCLAIREARQGPILIAVDQEGGRVQRFKAEFTQLPSMGLIGHHYEQSPEEGIRLAEACGWMMAAELLAVGVDISFAPVLDLDKQMNQVIADRSFHRNPEHVITLAKAFIQGMNNVGMKATGKHFPGHGHVTEDSHVAMPVDSRELADIIADDLRPFAALSGLLHGIMPAHIRFPAVDHASVGFSEYWLQSILRTQLEFRGIIFSDDLSMDGAGIVGDYPARAMAALSAGCNMILICNNRPAANATLHYLALQSISYDSDKLKQLLGVSSHTFNELRGMQEWQEKYELLIRSLS